MAAIAAALVIRLTGWYRADTLGSLLITFSYCLTPAAADRRGPAHPDGGGPRGLSLKVLEKALRGIDCVPDVHELHAWSLSSGFDAVTANLVVKAADKRQAALKDATCGVAAEFGVRHTVFQAEGESVENSSCDICR